MTMPLSVQHDELPHTLSPTRKLPSADSAVDVDLSLENFGTKALHHRRSLSSGSIRLSRPASLYTLTRTSFASQLAQLTSVQLPNAAALSARIPGLPTAAIAAAALSDAATQIKTWIRKAAQTLQDLDAQDDVEWAAAAGREGIDEMGQATAQFEALIKSYVTAMEHLQTREDVALIPDETMTLHVNQLESVVRNWQKVKERLKAIKLQEEIAMEWQELTQTAVADISKELDNLADLVFRMEEQRYASSNLAWATDSPDRKADQSNTTPDQRRDSSKSPARSRLSIISPSRAAAVAASSEVTEDSGLVALFARLQPLRASLDFLPMRLSTFQVRGKQLFPSACMELESTRETLELLWQKLEADAEALRNELGEDRWISVFRNAGRQALSMFGSIERTQDKLRDSVRRGVGQCDFNSLQAMTESYMAKRTHYVPAVEKVLNIIDKGVSDRVTVNGEILQLQASMRRRWTALQNSMAAIDALIDEGSTFTQSSVDQLRDSVSSVLSSEVSTASSNGDTQRSSPASSVVSQSRKGSFNQHLETPKALPRSRLPRASLLTPTGSSQQPSRANALKSMAGQRSVTSPSPNRVGLGRRDLSPLAVDNLAPLPSLTPSPRKYSSHYRASNEHTRSSSFNISRAQSPTPVVTEATKQVPSRYRPRQSLPTRSTSSFGFRTPSVADLSDTKSRTPAWERLQSGKATQSPMRARRNASFASLATAGETSVDSPRQYPPSASRNPGRPSTSMAVGYGDSQARSGRRSSLAAQGRNFLRSVTGESAEKPRWRF